MTDLARSTRIRLKVVKMQRTHPRTNVARYCLTGLDYGATGGWSRSCPGELVDVAEVRAAVEQNFIVGENGNERLIRADLASW